MSTVTVYGASDDLIEVDGAIREEWSWYKDEAQEAFLAFSDGTVLAICYGANDEGFWRIRRVAIGSAEYALVEGKDVDDDYSDKATLTGEFQWCVKGSEMARVSK